MFLNNTIVKNENWRYFVIFGCGSTFGVLSRGVAVVAFHFDLVKVGCSIQPPATMIINFKNTEKYGNFDA